MAAAATEGISRREVRLGRPVVAVGCYTAAELAFDPDKVFIEDEVHHARQRIGAIGRRRAAGHHIHAADEVLRKDVGVDGAIQVGRYDAMAVQEREGAGRAEAAQVEGVLPLAARRHRVAAGARAI
jgi:hypothetical protein